VAPTAARHREPERRERSLGEVPVPDWHRAELDRRLGHTSPGPGLSWNDVCAKLHERGQP